ncbi:uncharacterized protein LOC101774514 [Setaria italica]|uniref:uncharacterized protein LOC101774514 n=1 Tax=Setaria italica TaxID=4555 RepID=UPI000350D6CD|nr:uncharacterized protein LOC101774514 [Setaria italica]
MVDREPVPLNMLYYDYIGKVSTLADKLRLPYKGIEIWSEDRGHKANNNDPSMTKVADAFTRILEDIPAAGNKLDGGAFISVQEVDAALQKLQMSPDLTNDTDDTACLDASNTDGAVPYPSRFRETQSTAAPAATPSSGRSSPGWSQSSVATSLQWRSRTRKHKRRCLNVIVHDACSTCQRYAAARDYPPVDLCQRFNVRSTIYVANLVF